MALTAHLPSGVLRPPVAVGPLLDEPEPFYSSASPKKSFYGGWSFPAVQLDDDPPEPSAPRAESPPVPPRGPERRGWDLAGSNEVPIHNAPVSVRPPGSLAPQRLGAPISPRPLPALPSALSIPSTRVDSFPRPVPSGDPYVPQRPLSPAPLQDPYAPRLLEPQRFELQGRGGLTQDPYAPYNMLDRRPSQVPSPYAPSRMVPLEQLDQQRVPQALSLQPRFLQPQPPTRNLDAPQVSLLPGQRSYPPLPLQSASPLHPTSNISLRSRPATMPLRQSVPPGPPMSMQPQSMPILDPEDDHVPIPHRIEDMGDISRKAPKSQEKPPAWHEIEERPHLIEVELEELELHPDAPDLQPGWFESLKYFVSLHPRSEEPDHIPLPRDPPLQSVDGYFMVSQAQKAYKPATQVGFGDDAQDQNFVATFEEMMSLPMDKLDHHLVAYVWATKTTMMGAQTTTLVGRALAPLQDFQLQRKTTTWGIFDILGGHRVAEMRLRYRACTTPAAVEEVQSADVKQNEVTVRWAPPKNDHGAQVFGYKISILLDPQPNEPPQWYTLCECTKSKTPVYVVSNLKGNTAYLLDIRAVNKVGAGDAREFQITTAPVAPDPPSKPWVEEARDGCLNVAWTSPENDGGMAITAFRIRMRKILGASRWNPFGPGEAAASWIEMGSVAAAGDATMYNAWVGPLEMGACEYRFQIQALNKLGESKASELSEPHYT